MPYALQDKTRQINHELLEYDFIKLLNSFFIILFFFLVTFFFAQTAYAATFTVNSTADVVDANPGNGICATVGSVCTLRAAIQEANVLAGDDTITLPAGTYTLSLAGTGEDASATGDLDITDNITITGAGESSTIIDANNIDRVLDVLGSANLTMSNVTVRNGSAVGSSGGGIHDSWNGGTLTLTNVTVSGNTSDNDGGGIYSDRPGAIFTDVTIKNNTSTLDGGGIDVNSPASLTSVTISENTAQRGGGIFVNDSPTTFTNLTISNNTATVRGGGIFMNDQPTLTNVTIANNIAPADNGAGIWFAAGYTPTLKNTLLSSNSTDNCKIDVGSTPSSLGYNLSSDASCSALFNQTGDLNSTNPLLSSLADNGGSVQTMALQSGSLAIDGGTNTGCTSTDARGTTRPQDGDNNGTVTCDIGAYEYVYIAPISSLSSSSSSSSSNSSPACSASIPSGKPDLFQANLTSTSAKLYFKPVGNPVNFYTIEYGFNINNVLFGYMFSQGVSTGVLSRTINYLQPNTIYYFKIAAGNDCLIGLYSNTLKVKTQPKRTKSTKIFYEYFGKRM